MDTERPRYEAQAKQGGSMLIARDGEGRVAILERVERRGAEPPFHLHSREDEIVYVLEGALTYYVDEDTHHASAGTCVFLPRGCEHTFSVESDEARLLVMVVPAGLEDFYDELDGDVIGAATDIERLVTVAARYGVEITGPPPMTGEDTRDRMEQHERAHTV